MNGVMRCTVETALGLRLRDRIEQNLNTGNSRNSAAQGDNFVWAALLIFKGINKKLRVQIPT